MTKISIARHSVLDTESNFCSSLDICIIAHENVEHDLAMAYEVKAYQLREFADAIGLNYKLISQSVNKIATLISKALFQDGTSGRARTGTP